MPESPSGERAESAGRRFVREDRYVLVLFLILATLVSSAFLGDGTLGVILPLGFMCLTLVVTLGTSDAGPKMRLVGRVVVAVAFVSIVSAELFHYNGLARLGFFVAMLALSIVTPFVIVRRLTKHMTINIDTVAGAADIYLLIGLFFSVVYMTIGAIQAGWFNSLGPINATDLTPATAFFHASRPVGPADFIYYSLVTQTTVGYGDLTSTSNLGRMLSTTEALIGQLYLVTIVAVLVSNIGRTRRQPIFDREAALEAETPAETPSTGE